MGSMSNGGGAAARAGSLANGRGGRLQGTGGLTPKQRAFVKAYVRNGGKGPSALREAGYDYRNPSIGVRELLERPHVAEAIKRERQVVIDCELASRSLDAMHSLLTSPDSPAGVRFQVAKWILTQSGHTPGSGESAEQNDKPLSEMTLSEIQDFLRREGQEC